MLKLIALDGLREVPKAERRPIYDRENGHRTPVREKALRVIAVEFLFNRARIKRIWSAECDLEELEDGAHVLFLFRVRRSMSADERPALCNYVYSETDTIRALTETDTRLAQARRLALLTARGWERSRLLT